MAGETIVVVPAGGDEVAPLPADATAVVAAGEAAVAVAEIQADRDVAIAEIHAETNVAAIEAEADADDEDVVWLRNELAGLRGQCETNAGELSVLRDAFQSLETQMASLTETVVAQAAILSLLNPPPPSETTPETIPGEPPSGESETTGGEITTRNAVRTRRFL